MASSKLPAFMFYPGDWLKDPLLRACSLAARGLWMDLLCLMWDSPRRGYLMTGASQSYSLEQLARMVGCSAEALGPLLDELISVGVCSVKKDLIIYSRRVVRDEEKRAKDRLRQGECRRKSYVDQRNCHTDVTPHVTPVSQPSSSSSSSSSSVEDNTPLPPSSRGSLFPHAERFAVFWSEYPRKVGRSAAERKYSAVCRSEATHDAIMAGLFAQLPAMRQREDRYIPHPTTWLSQGRWMDEPESPSQALIATGKGQPVTTFAERKEQRMMQKFYEGLKWEASHGKIR